MATPSGLILTKEELEIIDEIRRLFDVTDLDGNQYITVGK